MFERTSFPITLVVFGLAVDAPAPHTAARTESLNGLPAARVEVLPDGELAIELAPVDLAAGMSHHGGRQPPVAVAELPLSGAVYGFRVEVLDSAGRVLPAALVHHFNLLDPAHRELFLPISRRLIAAGKETGTVRMPRLLLGFPVTKGERLVASVMLQNPTPVDYHGARTRLVLLYTPARRPWPVFRVFPWQLDVAFPVGDKSFDLPPGRSTRSYEGSPVVAGTIAAVGGHVHQYGRSIELVDAATGAVIWRATPVTDSAGHVLSMPIGRLYGWTRLGARIVPEHRYRVTVEYDNPTGRVLKAGGMGVVAGLFIPDRGVTWPAADTTDQLYRRDLLHALRRLGGSPEHTHH